jgi:hypothetical protein
MPVLSDAELRGIDEVVSATASSRGKSFDAYATGAPSLALRSGMPRSRRGLPKHIGALWRGWPPTLPESCCSRSRRSSGSLERDAEIVLSGRKKP